jgi:methionyl-tRNA formyltransferase
MSQKIVLVTAGGPHPWIIANALIDRFGEISIIREHGEPRSVLIRRRIRRFGYVNAAGQTAMMVWTILAKRLMRGRTARMLAETGLRTELPVDQKIIDVSSVNAADFRAALARLEPDVVFLVGCRMMKADVLSSIPCPVLNYHAGINPKYRGMNGGYWALAGSDPENFGGTVHLVDAGVDTGGTLYQARGAPQPDDNFMTYAFRQAALSRDICVTAVEDALAGRLVVRDVDLPSRQWFHPTIWGYFWTGLRRNVW